jgi:probable F420-dependent oxidoreductase
MRSAARAEENCLKFGLILPSYREGASTESIDAASETAARLGWDSVFTTDHLLVEPSERARDYFNIYDALVTVAHVAARQPSLRVGISVVVVPMRNAIVLAKELATLDSLSAGRLIVGVGVGWNATEFGYVGEADRFNVRGAYLEEAIAVWRHLWSGNTGQFHGRFNHFEETRFGPLPAQGENVPIWFGGRDERALKRAGRLGDGYHSSASSPSSYEPRIPIIRDAASEAGRPIPTFSARFRVAFDKRETSFFMLSGEPNEMVAGIREFEALGVSHVAVDFAETDAERCRSLMERFDAEVAAAFR